MLETIAAVLALALMAALTAVIIGGFIIILYKVLR